MEGKKRSAAIVATGTNSRGEIKSYARFIRPVRFCHVATLATSPGPPLPMVKTLLNAPTLSSLSSSSLSSSNFELIVSLSPPSRRHAVQLCPADELFYKGQLLPLHLSPRLSMVRTLLLSSVSVSSSDTATTASRDSNGSSSSDTATTFSADLGGLLPDCDSSRPSSVTEDDARRVSPSARRIKYLSSFTTRFSSVFLHRGSKKDRSNDLNINQIPLPPPPPPPPSKRSNSSPSSAKEVIKKYVKKVKPLYGKLSSLQQKQSQQQQQTNQSNQKKIFSFSIKKEKLAGSGKKAEDPEEAMASRIGIYSHSHSFSGNLRYPRRKRCAGSCPSSMRSSPSHSGLLCIAGIGGGFPDPPIPSSSSMNSSMQELQNAIEGAIAHCKSSMTQAGQSKASATVGNDGDEICGS